jgi:hypothetical protein
MVGGFCESAARKEMQGMVVSWLREGKEALWSCSGVMEGHWKWEGRVRGSGRLAFVFFFCKGRGRPAHSLTLVYFHG